MIKVFLTEPSVFLKYCLAKGLKDYYIIFGLVFLLLFLVFSWLVHLDLLTKLDWFALFAAQSITPVSFDLFFSFLSVIGSFEVYTLIALISFVYYKKIIQSFYFFILYGLGHIIEIFSKSFIHHPGPASEFLRFNFPFHLLSAKFHPGFAYPSGHSMRTVFLVLLVIWCCFFYIKSTGLRFTIVFLSLLYMLAVLYSRVSLAEHWLSDVIGGSLLGVSLSCFMFAVFSFYEKHSDH
ncbi:MAG: hypothetical protein KatS3mg091_245 [Patescibacteria group bacterium]|nr:MAG: hypothetical protein KatS3mg091_245 [Patescibacteria group bacterium]